MAEGMQDCSVDWGGCMIILRSAVRIGEGA